MSKDPEGIDNYADNPKTFEDHITDVKKLKELIDSLPSDVDDEVKQATEKIKREQDIDSARKKVLDSYYHFPEKDTHISIVDDTGKEVTLKQDQYRPPISKPIYMPKQEPIHIPEPTPPITPSLKPESHRMPEPFEETSDFFAPEPIPEPEPTSEPTPEPTPEPIPELTSEQPQFKGESEEIIKFEGRKTLDTLKQIHAKLASATPDQVQRFNTLYQELSDISKTTPTDLESERQKLTNLFDVRNKINQLQSEL